MCGVPGRDLAGGGAQPPQPGLEVAPDPDRPAQGGQKFVLADVDLPEEGPVVLGIGELGLEAHQLGLRRGLVHLEDLETLRLVEQEQLVDVPVEGGPEHRPVEPGERRLDPPPRNQRDPPLLGHLGERDDPGLASPGPHHRHHLVDDLASGKLGGATRKGRRPRAGGGQGKGEPPSGSQAWRLHGGNCSRTHPSGREPTLTVGAGALAFPRA
jgi:hypothetical protein